jgi:hypothetical protein
MSVFLAREPTDPSLIAILAEPETPLFDAEAGLLLVEQETKATALIINAINKRFIIRPFFRGYMIAPVNTSHHQANFNRHFLIKISLVHRFLLPYSKRICSFTQVGMLHCRFLTILSKRSDC